MCATVAACATPLPLSHPPRVAQPILLPIQFTPSTMTTTMMYCFAVSPTEFERSDSAGWYGRYCQAVRRAVVVRASWIPPRRQPFVVKFDKRGEPFDQLKLKLARHEALILLRSRDLTMLRVSAVASQAFRDKAAQLFTHVCVYPKVLSVQAVEFMLTVAASQATLSQSESEAASQVDLILQGVHPTSFKRVLLVCTTTMFATPVANSDVEKAQRRAELWRRAVGPAFVVVPVVAGYEVSPEVAAFSVDMGVVSCDISK